MDKISSDMAGRIMAHAFNDELEKISAAAQYLEIEKVSGFNPKQIATMVERVVAKGGPKAAPDVLGPRLLRLGEQSRALSTSTGRRAQTAGHMGTQEMRLGPDPTGRAPGRWQVPWMRSRQYKGRTPDSIQAEMWGRSDRAGAAATRLEQLGRGGGTPRFVTPWKPYNAPK